MNVYRNISISFWTDRKITDNFSPEDKYFYLYLLTNPLSNISGCFEFSFRRASMETGYSVDSIRVILQRLEDEHNVIKFDKETFEVLILHFFRYNWSLSDKLKTAVIHAARQIRSEELKSYVLYTVENLQVLKKERTKERNINNNSITETETETGTVSVSVSEIDTEIDTDTETTVSTECIDTVSIPYKKDEKHKYGAMKNVLLSNSEYQKLIERFPDDYGKRIDDLSYGLATYGYKYKSHYMAILTWDRRDKEKAEQKQTKKGRNDFIDELR